jgi:hypothetical protein
MKIFVSGLLVFLSLCLISIQAEGQSRSPVQDRRAKVKPASSSKRPWGSNNKRPLTRSIRSMYEQPKGIDYGVNLGTAHALTDIGGTGETSRASFLDTQWSETSLNAGVFLRYKFSPLFSLKSSFNYASISGSDLLSGESTSRFNRGFEFSNTIYELAFTGEFYIPKNFKNPLDVYGFLGIAAFYHDPDLLVPNPDRYEFDLVNTLQPAIPIGIGAFYQFPNSMRVGYEIGWRKTFFDHLDGFTRPASKGNDSYYFGKIKLSYFVPVRR